MIIATKVAVRVFGFAFLKIEIDANLKLTFWKSRCKTNGWLGELMAVPCTLNGGAKEAPTMLFTLA